MYKGECTGLAFSPDGMHLYIAYQDEGVLLDVFRRDSLPFHAKSLNIKYHQAVGNKLNGNKSGEINIRNGNGGNNKNNNGGGGSATNTAKARTGGGDF